MVTMYFLFKFSVIEQVLKDNKLPGGICSMICGGADIGFVLDITSYKMNIITYITMIKNYK